MSITAFLKRYIRDQAICTIEAAAEQSESTNRAASRHQQRMHMPMVAHFQRWHFAPAPPFPLPKKNSMTIFYYSGYKFLVVLRGSRKQRQRCPHVMQEARANTCIQLVVMEIRLNGRLPNIISKNITRKWKRTHRMWMEEWVTKWPDCSQNNLQRGLETFPLLD